jgi:riboflavin synthase
MFTGIVEATGRVRRVSPSVLEVSTDLEELKVGDSISVNGVCLTVRSRGSGFFSADLSEQTASATNLGSVRVGDGVNLEIPLRAGSPIGGHIVQGHVDGTAKVRRVDPLEGSVVLWIEIPKGLGRYLAAKGSVAVDGVSLTIAELGEEEFSVSLVPHTLSTTNLLERAPGDLVNIEVDVVAKYVERLLQERNGGG